MLVIIFVCAGILFFVSRGNLFHTALPTKEMPADVSLQSDLLQEAADKTAAPSPSGFEMPSATLPPAQCYLLISVGDVVFEPYPLLKEQDLPITQTDGKQNVVHVSPNGFYMSSSNCSNQDCVHQGEVTLQNRDQRLLFNQVVCLPNQVMLELLTPEEAAVVWENKYEQKK